MTVDGTKLIEKVSANVVEIDSKIKELQAEKQRLETVLNTTDNAIDVEVTKNQESLKHDLEVTESMLQRAEQEKQAIISKHADNVVDEALQIMKNFKQNVKSDHKDDNKRIIEALDEIQTIYVSMFEKDCAYTNSLKAFVSSVKPYLSNEEQLNRLRAEFYKKDNESGLNVVELVKLDVRNLHYAKELLTKEIVAEKDRLKYTE